MSLPPQQPPALARRLILLAERDPRRAVVVARRFAAADGAGPRDPWLTFALGWTLLAWERFELAREAFATAMAGPIDAAPELRARCQLGLALTSFHLQPGEAASDELAQAGAALYRIGAMPEANHACIIRAALLNILGRVPEALAALSEIERQGPAGRDALGARWRRVRAAAAYAQGDFVAAAALLDEAAAIFRALGCRADLAKCWYEQGALSVRVERYELALSQYQQAERVFATLDLPLRRALCAHDCAHVLIRLGAYDDALAVLLPALDYFTAIGRARDVARCYLLLGNIFWFTGSWHAALAGYSAAERIFASIGMAAAERLTAQRNRALIYRAIGKLDRAWALLLELERQADKLGAEADRALIQYNQAELLADRGELARAHARFAEAQARFERLGNLAAAAASRLEQGWLLLAAGEYAAARTLFLAAAPDLAAQPHARWRNEYGLARCAEVAGQQTAAVAAYLQACKTVASLRGRLASELFSSNLYQQAHELYHNALRFAVSVDAAAAVLALTDEQRAIALRRVLIAHSPPLPPHLREQHERLVARIWPLDDPEHATAGAVGAEAQATLTAFGELVRGARHRQPEEIESLADRLAGIPDADLGVLRGQLNQEHGQAWTVLVYLLLETTLVAVVVTPTRVELCREPFDDQLRRLIARACDRRYRRYIYDDLGFLQGQAVQPWATLARLGTRLIPHTVRARLAPTHRLIIVPCDGLHLLPWGALRSDGSWLAERAVVQLAPSVSILAQLARREPPFGAEALLIGCSAFHGRAPDLPGVADELALVGGKLPMGHRQLSDDAALCTTLRRHSAAGELERYRIVHIASHAQLLPGHACAAHLKLWDGDLTLAEVASLRLRGALVVLSACEGAGTELLPGEEVLSLSRAFIAAGAFGVVASMWPVYEGCAFAFMERFYTALATHNDAAEAVAAAQRALAGASEVAGLASPRCWASFVLVGASRAPWR